jgi:hypothetical protein
MSEHLCAPASGHGGHARGRWYYQLLHHLLAAALMASAMLALEKARWMDWLDAVMLNVVGTEAPDSSLPRTALPQLVLIDGQAYADTFKARSPLDRDALGRLLGELLATPAALLVDLQLEPAPDEAQPRALDQLLLAARGRRANTPACASRCRCRWPERPPSTRPRCAGCACSVRPASSSARPSCARISAAW